MKPTADVMNICADMVRANAIEDIWLMKKG